MPLTGAAARQLRALAHHLDPVVQVGKGGVTKTVVTAISKALHDHELIKVKVLSEAPVDRKIAAGQIASQAVADVVQVIGRIVILYKPRPKKPTIKVPKGYTAPQPVARALDEDEEE
jgi:RNA-binding protein